MSETSEKLDHTLQAYGRLERKHGERGRELTAVKAERDAYKAALEELVEAAKAIRWCVLDPYSPSTDIKIESDSWRSFRSVLAGVVSTREKEERAGGV